MSEMATTELRLTPAAVATDNGGDSDVLLSPRDGAVGEDFSSGISEAVANDASQLDLVAVAGGEEELDTFMDDGIDLKDMPALVDALSLAGKSEINSSENRMSDERRAAICQGVASAACASCAARDDCPILRMRNFANENLQPAPERESYLKDLLNDGDDGIVVAGYANPDSGADSTNADITETSDDKTDKLIEQVAPPNQGNEIFTNETTESPDKPADIKEPERSFFEPTTTSEAVVGGSEEIREVQPENVSEASVNTSGEEQFTEPTEESRPSIEIKQQASDVISSAADKENQQPAFESPDIPTQTKTRTVPPSPAVSEDTQTGDESRNSLKNGTTYHTASDDKVAASVVENTYDGDENTASSSIKTPSIEHQKENDFVITGSKSVNSEPSRVAERDKDATPVSEQQHLAAQFEAVKVDESAIAEPVDNSNMKSPKSTQRSEVKLEAVKAYNDFTRSSDYTEGKQPEDLALDVGSIPLPQKRMITASVLAKYDENETYQSPDSYSIGQSGGTPQAVLLQEQILVESSESSLAIGNRANFDNNLIQLKIDDVETDVSVANDVVNTTNKTDVAASIEMIDITPNLPYKHTVVDRNDTQLAVDLPQELGDELAVGTDAGEPQIPAFRQLDRSDAAMGISRSEDKIWTEEEVFFVEQDLPGMEPELTLTEVVAVISPVEAVTALEEVDELPETRETNTALQLNASKSSVREIAMYDSNERETQTISLPIIEKTTNVELDKIIPKELYLPDGNNKTTSVNIAEKSDLPHKQDEALAVEADDLEPVVNLPKESEAAFADEVAEAMNYELGKQDEPIITSDEKKLSRNSEADTVDNSGVIVNTCPSLGLWPDDSRLNPEEEAAAATQSSADDTSLVSRLVGMFVVAMCVVRGRQARAIPNS